MKASAVFAILLAGALLAGCNVGPAKTRNLVARCQVAEAVLDRFAGGKRPWQMVVSSKLDNGAQPDDKPWRIVRRTWDRDRPSRELVAWFVGDGRSNAVVDCPDFVKSAQAHGVRLLEGLDPVASAKAERLVMSTPVISPDGKTALAAVSRVLPGRGGISLYMHLRKDAAGAWAVTDSSVSKIG